MPTDSPKSIRALALAVLAKSGTVAGTDVAERGETLSHGQNAPGTGKIESDQRLNPTVPLSHVLGQRQWDCAGITGTAAGTVVGQ